MEICAPVIATPKDHTTTVKPTTPYRNGSSLLVQNRIPQSTGRQTKPRQMDFPADDCRVRLGRHDGVASIDVNNAATGMIAKPDGKRRAQPQSNDMLKLPERINLHGLGLRRSERLRQLKDEASARLTSVASSRHITRK